MVEIMIVLKSTQDPGQQGPLSSHLIAAMSVCGFKHLSSLPMSYTRIHTRTQLTGNLTNEQAPPQQQQPAATGGAGTAGAAATPQHAPHGVSANRKAL